MIAIMPESHDDLLAVRAIGRLNGEDYEQCLAPRLEALIRKFPKLRVLFFMDETFSGWDLKAAWDNTVLDFRHRADFERIAIVGAPIWEEWCVRLARVFIRAEFRTFPRDRLQEAIGWLDEDPQSSGLLHDDDTGDPEIWSIERRLWLEGAPAFEDLVDRRCVIAIGAPIGILSGGDRIVASLSSAPRWESVTMTESTIGSPDSSTRVLAYRAEAKRPGAAIYSAYCTSTYRQQKGRWRLIQHQQTPTAEPLG